jgi:GAF domain-containing protein
MSSAMSEVGTLSRSKRFASWLKRVGIPGFIAAAAYVLQGAFREDWPHWISWSLLGVGGALTFWALAAAARIATKETRLRVATEQAAQDAAQAVIKYRQRINDGLRSHVILLNAVVNPQTANERRELQSAMKEATVNFASARLGTERTRACFFKYEPGPPRRLVHDRSTGRDDQPRPEFVDGTPAGSFVFGVLDSPKGTRLWQDVESSPPPGSTNSGTYKTFITAKVASGDKLFGMLGIDSPEPGVFNQHDEIFVGIIAMLLGTALAAGNRRQGNSGPGHPAL